MDPSTRAIILLILILLLMLALAFVGSRLLLKRAITRVIKMFRDNQATDAASAKSPEELGLKSRGLFAFGGLRDYKPVALQLLMKGNIVQETEDGRLYLSEALLSGTSLE